MTHESLLAEAESRIVVLDRLHDEAATQRDTLQMRLADMQAKLDAVGRLPDEWLAAVRKNGVYDEFDSGLNAARTSDANELRAALGGEWRGDGEERK